MALPYQTVLVTGGAGFVGSSLSVWLKSHYPGTRVVALDNLKRRGSELNLPRLREHGVEFLHGDIRTREDLGLDNLEPQAIIECSAEPSVLAGYGDGAEYVVSTNLFGTADRKSVV